MSSLLTEILISLVVIAVIGGIIGWLVRGAHMNNREVNLDGELKEHRDALEQASAKVRKLEASMKQMNSLRKSEREQLEGRIRELEPLFDIVEKRDARIRQLTEDLKTAQDARQAELDDLEFKLNTKRLFADDDDESEVSRLQNDLRLANSQRESALARYQNQVRQIEDLENIIKEREQRVEEMTRQLNSQESLREREQQGITARLAALQQQLKQKQEEFDAHEKRKRQEIQSLGSRAEKAESRIDELREKIQNTEELKNEFLTRENELKKELSDLHSELVEKEIAIAKLQKQVLDRTPRSATLRALPTGNRDTADPPAVSGLQLLKGIGPTTEVKLRNLGVATLEQMACLEEKEIERICETLPNFTTQLKRYEWIENAKRLTAQASDGQTREQSS
jgi:predicted flap endonuclease-1-like 5' DNA nuclease